MKEKGEDGTRDEGGGGWAALEVKEEGEGPCLRQLAVYPPWPDARERERERGGREMGPRRMGNREREREGKSDEKIRSVAPIQSNDERLYRRNGTVSSSFFSEK